MKRMGEPDSLLDIPKIEVQSLEKVEMPGCDMRIKMDRRIMPGRTPLPAITQRVEMRERSVKHKMIQVGYLNNSEWC